MYYDKRSRLLAEYTRGLQTTALGPEPARKGLQSGPRRPDSLIIGTTHFEPQLDVSLS